MAQQVSYWPCKTSPWPVVSQLMTSDPSLLHTLTTVQLKITVISTSNILASWLSANYLHVYESVRASWKTKLTWSGWGRGPCSSYQNGPICWEIHQAQKLTLHRQKGVGTNLAGCWNGLITQGSNVPQTFKASSLKLLKRTALSNEMSERLGQPAGLWIGFVGKEYSNKGLGEISNSPSLPRVHMK